MFVPAFTTKLDKKYRLNPKDLVRRKRQFRFSFYFPFRGEKALPFASKKPRSSFRKTKFNVKNLRYAHWTRTYLRRGKTNNRSDQSRWTVQPVFMSRTLESGTVLPALRGLMAKLTTYNHFWTLVWSTSMNSYLSQQILKRKDFFLKKYHISSFLRYPASRAYLYTFTQLCFLYKVILQRTYLRFSHYLYHRKGVPSVTYNYNLYFTFTPNRFYINLCDHKGVNYLSLSVGLLLKFFKYQKALKKNKSLKFLIVKFLRKLLIVSKINDLTIFLKRMPVLVSEVFKFLLSPLPAPFQDPITHQQILEEGQGVHSFRIWYLYFLKTVSYTSMKGRQKGRVKRKIAKKVISKNRITDEA